MPFNPAKRSAESGLMEYDTIKELIWAIPNALDKWLCATTYANGSRIMETCLLRYCDFEATEDFLYIHTIVLKKRGKIVKRRSNPIDRKLEPWLTETIWGYIKANRLSPTDTRIIWDFSKKTAQRRFDKYFNTFPHALRHNRATHLIKRFGYSTRDLKEYFELSDRSMGDWANRYGHLERTYLEDKFKKLRKSQN